MNGNGVFGKWFTDQYGLPAYEYICNQFKDSNARYFTTHGYSIDHFHQIGNDRITATAHNGGYIQVLESSRGFQWLTYKNPKKGKLGGGITLFNDNLSQEYWSDLYELNVDEKFDYYKRIFGMGYFQKRFKRKELEITHNICTPFSNDPVIISEIEVFNDSNSQKKMKIIDLWDINLHHITKSLIVTSNKRKLFGTTKLLNIIGNLIKVLQKIVKMDTDGSRYKFDKKFKYEIILKKTLSALILFPKFKKKPPVDPTKPAKHNYYPNPIFISILNGIPINYISERKQILKFNEINIKWNSNKEYFKNNIKKINKNPCLGICTELELNPKEKKSISFIFGYANFEDIENLIKKYKKIVESNSILEYNCNEWKKNLIELECENESWLLRETKWHSYYIRSAAFYDEYYEQHKFPQGSIYLFGHGFDGAIRDFVLYLKSIIFLSPKLAKEYLLSILELMSQDGKLPYGLYGFGKTLSAAVHSKPSDLYLFLIWGIIQYVYATRDLDFLDKEVPFYPKMLNKSSTVFRRILISLDYLFSNKVGFGEHNLIKSNDGDWSDGISLMVKSRKKFIKYGESTFNSTFALYLLPKIMPLLKNSKPELVKNYENIIIKLKAAVLKAFNGKWFYRGWDGQGNPIGDKNIYLEHHTWLLISEILEKKRATQLIENIYKILDKPSPIGQYISYPPQKVSLNILPEGWDVNGGIWHAMNSLMTWAYSKYDSEKAFNSLKKNSMANRADVYRNIWYGIWSGPDAYIADYAENAGQAFYHLATPMCDFPLMNLNIHACYLLSVIKMVGFEAFYDSITIAPKLNVKQFKFKSPLLTIELKVNLFSLKYNPCYKDNFKIKIKKPNWWNNQTKIFLNNEIIAENNKTLTYTDDFIVINIFEKYKSINIVMKN
ncbi:MAG: GH36-type glycosyl hydrolase domain-containing protein [Promethearchaeota archaeon]